MRARKRASSWQASSKNFERSSADIAAAWAKMVSSFTTVFPSAPGWIGRRNGDSIIQCVFRGQFTPPPTRKKSMA